MRPGPRQANAIAAASILLWATAFPATDLLLASWTALPLAAARVLVAALAMLLLALALGERRCWRRTHLGPAAVLGGLGLGGSVGLLILGQDRTDGLTAAVLVASMPAVAALLEVPRRGPPAPLALLGIGLAVAGGTLLTWRPEAGGLVLRGGEPLVLASVVVWAWYSRAVAGRLQGLPPTSQSALTLGAGGLVLLLAALASAGLGLAPLAMGLGARELALALWVGAVAVGLSLPLWLVAVRELGLVPAAIHQNLAPFYVLAIGWAAGAGPSAGQILAAALVVAGALLAQLAAARPAAPAAERSPPLSRGAGRGMIARRPVGGTSMAMRLTSPAFAAGQRIPERHTCDGADLSPALSWSGAPPATRSFVLVCEDPDAPAGTWHHWAVFDVPAEQTSLPEGLAKADKAGRLRQAVNDFRKPGYGGPCPPKGHGTHRYRFRLLALSVASLPLGPKPGCREVLAAAEPHVLAGTELVGVYAR